ncbi:MAG: DUF429 domain-containing protein, partial [Dehalococcoidales bacterium]|nr:DUF429 domain-containing protein [Dehalococcoidales bacterium]
SVSGTIIGYDPGGNNKHGLAKLIVKNGKARSISTHTLKTAENIIAFAKQIPDVIGLGVDTLTCWGTGKSGWRPADRWLQEQYAPVQKSVINPNYLSGAMTLNGMAFLISLRTVTPETFVTETHPKVLFWRLVGKKYNYALQKVLMNSKLTELLGITVAATNEHEWDAALSAFATLEGLTKRWGRDLHLLPLKDEHLISPSGITHFCWPD